VTTSLDPGGALSLAKLEQLLTDLAALAPIMIQAIEDGDDARLLAGLQAARSLRARLGTSGAVAHAQADSLADVARVRELLASAQVVEKIADRWLARPLPPDHELMATPDGRLYLADAMLPAVWDFERDLVVLVGPGVARLAGSLRQLGQQRILWYRAGDGEAAADGADDSTAALRVDEPDELALAVRAFGVEMPERLVVRALEPDMRPSCAEVEELFRTARQDVLVHRNTVVTFNRTWLEQGLANLPALCTSPSVTALAGGLAGAPLVIIAPGPSLARNIHLLTQLKGKAVLMAVSHALTALGRAGVTPDFVLAVDPQDVRYHYAGTRLDGVAAVINGVTVHPGLFALGAPRTLWLSANGAIDGWLGDLVGEQAVVSGGGSVATTAFSLAVGWGCDPIAVVGLDLSFPGGKYYVESGCDGEAHAVVSADGRTVSVEGWSSDFHRMKATSTSKRRSERVVELPGWHGEPVPSSFMFTLFHSWFVEQLRRRASAAEYFNCTEGGAYIEGMKHVPLAAFAERIAGSEVDAAAVVSSAVARIDPAGRRRGAARHLGELAASLRRCRRAARRCARLAESHSSLRSEADLARAERDLLAQLRSLSLLSMMAQQEIGDALLSAREVMTVAEAVQRSRRLFELIDVSAGWLVTRVLEARQVVLSGDPA
jgi:hypothetical protein